LNCSCTDLLSIIFYPNNLSPPLFEKHGIEMDLPATMKKIEEEAIIPIYKKYKLPFKQYEIALS